MAAYGTVAPNDTDEEATAKHPLLNDIGKRDDFHQHRWRCLTRPERAEETLGPAWRLELNIEKASDIAAGSSVFLDQTRHFKVKVFLNDVVKFTTPSARSSASPTWNFSKDLDFTVPDSILRLQVVEAGSGSKEYEVAFVEFVAGDLAIDKLYDGSLELRFMENLQDTTDARLTTHRTVREDSLALETTSLDTADEDIEKKYGVKKLFYMSRKARPKSMLSCCSNGGKPGGPGANFHLNAGELKVKLKLKRLGSCFDGFCSYALFPSGLTTFAKRVNSENADEIPAQAITDDLQQIKISLWDDCVIPVKNSLTYVVTWRSPLLSLAITVIFVAMCCFTWYFLAVIPFVCALILLLNSSTSLRHEMIYAGDNAPLDQYGFDLVARLGRSSEMETYLRRVIGSFEGAVRDEEELKTLARFCFRDGKPLLKLEVLVEKLKGESWISTVKKLPGNALVWVDSVKPAKVCSDQTGDTVEVQYEHEAKREHVSRSRVKQRYEVSAYSAYSAKVLSVEMEAKVRNFHTQAADMRNLLLPTLESIRKIMTWESKVKTLGVVIVLLVCSAIGAFVAVKEEGNSEETYWGHIATICLASLDNLVFLLVGLAILLPQSGWFVFLKSFFRACGGLTRMHRRGPDTWVYFQPASKAAATSVPATQAAPAPAPAASAAQARNVDASAKV